MFLQELPVFISTPKRKTMALAVRANGCFTTAWHRRTRSYEGRENTTVSVSHPFGFGLKYALNRQISVGLEYGARWTFCDYIDDVSTTYIDNNWLASKDPQAAVWQIRASKQTTIPTHFRM
jgi:hypothetical protein